MHIYKRKKRNVCRKQETEPQIHLHDVCINMKQDKSYSQIILEFLEENYPNWYFGYSFVNTHISVKGKSYWLGSSADRLARQLSEDGLIEKKREGKYVQFRAIRKPIRAQKS